MANFRATVTRAFGRLCRKDASIVALQLRNIEAGPFGRFDWQRTKNRLPYLLRGLK